MSSFSAFLNFSIVLRFDHLRLSSFNAWILPHFAALADDLNVKTLLSAAGCDTRRSDQLAVKFLAMGSSQTNGLHTQCTS